MDGSLGTRLENPAPACGDLPGLERLLLKVDEVGALLSISRRTVWKLVSTGELPKPIYVRRAARWRYQDIQDYVENL